MNATPVGGCGRGAESSCVALFGGKIYAIVISSQNVKFLPFLDGFIAEEIIGTAVALDGGPSLYSGHIIVT